MKFLILGSKEYPPGSSKGFDSLPSGGMEVYTEGLAKALTKEGHKAAVVTRRFDERNFEETQGVEVHRVGWVKGFFLRNPSFNLNALRKARKIDYDACIASGVFATLSGLVLRKLNGKPVIARPAGIAWVQPQYNFAVKKALKSLEKFAYSHADAVVFLSAEEKKAFNEKMGFLPKKSVVIPTGVDVSRFQQASGAKLRKEYGGRLVVFLGRLMAVKGAEYLVEAMKGVNGKLLVVGEGSEEEKLRQLASLLGVSDRVKFFGRRADVPEILRAADVFVLPSLSEGLPIAMLEAMAAGKACVVTDIGLPVKHGENALVVQPKDPEAIAKAVNLLLEDRQLRERLGLNAVRHMKNNFSWDKAAKAYVTLARQLTGAQN